VLLLIRALSASGAVSNRLPSTNRLKPSRLPGHPRKHQHPAKIAAAHKVFIVNGGDDLAYDTVYAAFKQWPRFTVVDSAVAADLVIEIRSIVTDRVSHSHVNGRALPDPPLMLVISDPGTHDQLWSSLERRRIAIRQQNRDKETIATAERLVANLKARLGPS
jgi:hypothetical protein